MWKLKTERFVPLWRWRIPPRDKKQETRFYKNVLNVSRTGQFGLGVLAIFHILVFREQFSEVFFSAAANNKLSVPVFITDILMFVAFAYILGLKRMPVNYVALAITKTVISLDVNLRSKPLPDLQIRGQPSIFGFWTILNVQSLPSQTPPTSQSYLKHSVLLLVILGALVAIQKIIKLDWRDYKTTTLITQVVTSSSAALLLVVNLIIGNDPEMKQIHRYACEIWTLFALTSALITFLFLFERLRHTIQYKSHALNFMHKAEWEGFVLIIIVGLTVRYIPMIHKGFSYPKLLEDKLSIFLKLCIPSYLAKAWEVFSIRFYQVGEQVANLYAER